MLKGIIYEILNMLHRKLYNKLLTIAGWAAVNEVMTNTIYAHQIGEKSTKD